MEELMINTDFNLAAEICSDVGRAYTEAVEFTRVLPSYTLVRYRDALDYICDRIAERRGVKFHSQSVYDKINALNDAGAITFGFKDRCHQLRRLCNPGAHRASLNSADKKLDDLKDELAQLEANALRARELMLWILESMYKTLFPEAVLNYSRASIDTQDWKDLLFRATTNEDPVLKYKAGLWCEAEAHKRELNFKGFIAPNEFDVDQAFFKRLAAVFFYASFKLVPNIDAGFRYAKFVEQGKIDGHNVDEARLLIERAAKAGHGEACDYYAVILYKDKNDYPEAERYWQLAAQNDVTRAYYCLSVFYTEGKACPPQPAKAKEFLEKGVEQDCRDCLYSLGRAYFEGEW
jgi:TPR repeat protein